MYKPVETSILIWQFMVRRSSRPFIGFSHLKRGAKKMRNLNRNRRSNKAPCRNAAMSVNVVCFMKAN